MIRCFISCLTQLITNRRDSGIRSIGLWVYRSMGLLVHRFTDLLARKPFPRFVFCVLSFGGWASVYSEGDQGYSHNSPKLADFLLCDHGDRHCNWVTGNV